MNYNKFFRHLKLPALALAVVALAAVPSFAKDVYLVAKEFQQTLPSSNQIPAVDFSVVEDGIQTYGQGQDANGATAATVEDGGATLHLVGNTWKKINFSYAFTANTVLEFDFKSTVEGEIHGIGFDNNNGINQTQTYQLYGTQTWGIQDNNNYPAGADADGWTHYVIPIGTSLAITPTFMTFTMDHDVASPTAESYFRNVMVHEAQTGPQVTMWGFAEDLDGFDQTSGINSNDPEGEPTAPGSVIRVDGVSDPDLTIYLRNDLVGPSADAVSVFIPGQLKATAPVMFTDGQGRDRVRSFDAETAVDNVGVYTWTNLKEGTYLYHSGTHPQVQVQMGLYGALVVTGTEYPAVTQDAVLVYSEIDPALHAAVADGTYGTATYPSTFDYKPRYFLINGAAYPDGEDIGVNTNADMLLRFVNAGLKTHVPTLEGGLYMSLIAEDGNLYPFPVEQYGVELPAAKTVDAVINVGTDGGYALYDRALGLTNWLDTGGGMLTYLQAGATPTVVNFGTVTGGIQSYAGGQDGAGSFTIEDAGATLRIVGNAWKKIAFSYAFTPSTILEFDFSSTIEGEIHGIGFDSDDIPSQPQTYQLYGTQTWGIQTYNTYPGGPTVQHYSIPVGLLLQGTDPGFMTFTMDHDGGAQNGESVFSNVTVHE